MAAAQSRQTARENVTSVRSSSLATAMAGRATSRLVNTIIIASGKMKPRFFSPSLNILACVQVLTRQLTGAVKSSAAKPATCSNTSISARGPSAETPVPAINSMSLLPTPVARVARVLVVTGTLTGMSLPIPPARVMTGRMLPKAMQITASCAARRKTLSRTVTGRTPRCARSSAARGRLHWTWIPRAREDITVIMVSRNLCPLGNACPYARFLGTE